jgi:predicted hydrocarbon binding protein
MATTGMDLPVAYVQPGQSLAQVFAELGGWQGVPATLQAIDSAGAHPRVLYAYQPPAAQTLVTQLVLDVAAADGDEASLGNLLAGVQGARVLSTQPPTEAGLVMAEQQHPQLVGAPAVIFGRPIIGSLTRGVIEANGDAGARVLSAAGRNAGRLAASALPPLLEQLGIELSDDLLRRRISDLQVVGWATVERASIDGDSRGEVTLRDTFEAAVWEGGAPAPSCHFLSGFIAGVFSFAWDRTIDCRELECQGAGAAACRFEFGAA